jgi:hypothetical protein
VSDESENRPDDEPHEIDAFEARMQKLVPNDDEPLPAVLVCPRCEAAISTGWAATDRGDASLSFETTKGPRPSDGDGRWIRIEVDGEIVHECGEHWPPVW